LSEQWQAHNGASMQCLFPQTVNLNPTDFVLVMEMEGEIKALGFQFEVFGKNPLFIYLLSELGVTLLWFFNVYHWLYENIFQPAGNYFGSFLFAISIMLACWLVGYILNKRKVYVRV